MRLVGVQRALEMDAVLIFDEMKFDDENLILLSMKPPNRTIDGLFSSRNVEGAYKLMAISEIWSLNRER